MNKIAYEIKSGKKLVSDGAWGTFLQKMGMGPGECPELWNIEKPGQVYKIAKSYIDAGADMIETNSFGGSFYKLANYGLQHRVVEINRAAAEISRRAAGKEKHVLGSVGPTGKMLIMGDVTEEDLYNAFKEQAIALYQGGADAIVIETMSDLDEARIAVKAARENTAAEIICTMTFEKTVNGEYRSMMGVSPTDMVNIIIDAGADIIGANCGNGIEGMIDIVKEIRKNNADIPVLIHANAGLPVYQDGQTIFPETPVQMASFVGKLLDAGANVIGGCCGTTPLHITKIAETIKNHTR
ncbi:MAG: homocysteine S-methyltransferase family protein [Bacteroidales bacterium]|nr:homocysteine S-methyltransferase family protein [Bacteroidales bacterium]